MDGRIIIYIHIRPDPTFSAGGSAAPHPKTMLAGDHPPPGRGGHDRTPGRGGGANCPRSAYNYRAYIAYGAYKPAKPHFAVGECRIIFI